MSNIIINLYKDNPENTIVEIKSENEVVFYQYEDTSEYRNSEGQFTKEGLSSFVDKVKIDFIEFDTES